MEAPQNQTTPATPAPTAEQNPLEQLGQAISNLFGGGK